MKKLVLLTVLLALVTFPLSALALEKMSGPDMGDVVGQAGVSIGFGGTTTTRIDFSQFAWGDPDGVPTACGNNAGWIIIDGDVIIDQVIGCGQIMTIDIGTTSAGGTCLLPPCNVPIPGSTTFIALGLPTTSLSITVPATLVIGLGSTSAAVTGTLGILNLRNLDVTAGSPQQLYIWAH